MTVNALRRAFAFTLIELLVVVAIIALLISILLPSLGQARAQARSAVCKSGMRQMGMASLTYVSEYGVYPPSISNFAHSKKPDVAALRWQHGRDWLGVGDQAGVFNLGDPNDPNSSNPKGIAKAPTWGRLFPLINQEKAYLCPDDRPGAMEPGTLLGGGGNGKFSYTMFTVMGLRPPEKVIPRWATKSGPARGPQQAPRRMTQPPLSRVPLFVEEHPQGINDTKSPSGHMEGNFNFDTDFVVSRHPGGNYRFGIDPISGEHRQFQQGVSNLAFADGHVEGLLVNFGYTAIDVKPTTVSGRGRTGIPYTSEGLLWHFGIEGELDSITGESNIIPVQ